MNRFIGFKLPKGYVYNRLYMSIGIKKGSYVFDLDDEDMLFYINNKNINWLRPFVLRYLCPSVKLSYQGDLASPYIKTIEIHDKAFYDVFGCVVGKRVMIIIV